VRTRLQKLVAAAGLASRRQAEQWIRAGRVQVNGAIARIGDSADPQRDDVRVDGRPLPREARVYWLLHKPRGALSTTSDPHARAATVLELLPAEARRRRLFPVGRLDLDSEGLLLLTNDGSVAQALLHPSLGTEREYRVSVRGRLTAQEARALAQGPLLEDGPMAPCEVGRRHYDPRADRTSFRLTLREGRKRQIRRALAQLGHPVVRLVRLRMGPLRLGALPEGAARRLGPREVAVLVRYARGRRARAAPRRSGRKGRGSAD